MQRLCGFYVDPRTKHEQMELITADYPYRAHLCELHSLPGGACPWHWHWEIEVFYMRSGRLEYQVPGGRVVFEEGQGGLVNSNVLHKSVALPGGVCHQEEQQFLPEFIGGFAGSLVMQKYVRPILDAPGLEIVKLDPQEQAHRPLLETICRAYALSEQSFSGQEMELQRMISHFWQELFALTSAWCRPAQAGTDDRSIKRMLYYIAAHYGEKLTLQEIAGAAFMSVRACGRCFQEQLGTTPFTYLADFRMQKACELLELTDMPVGEVALMCGFGSNSHFGLQFQKKMGMSPTQYRRRPRVDL